MSKIDAKLETEFDLIQAYPYASIIRHWLMLQPNTSPGKNAWTPDEGLFSNHDDVANSIAPLTPQALIQDQIHHTIRHS